MLEAKFQGTNRFILSCQIKTPESCSADLQDQGKTHLLLEMILRLLYFAKYISMLRTWNTTLQVSSEDLRSSR